MFTHISIILIFACVCRGWRAVPANLASFSQRRAMDMFEDQEKPMSDELLPRESLHSIFKFGFCRPESTSHVYLKSTASIHFPTFESTQGKFVYVEPQPSPIPTISYIKETLVTKYNSDYARDFLSHCDCNENNITSKKCLSILRDFSVCHSNFNLKPADGMLKEHTFTWLGFVQYIHVTTGLPHHSKAPRIVLIQKQFGLGTATDMLHLPKNYKLGNIIFGDYERDEEDCGLTRTQIKLGVGCPRAYIEMPIKDITPHPEFSRFGVGNSLALIKFIRPMKSHYMIPVCLPTLTERTKKKKNKVVFMIDYISSVPRDFDNEKMGKKTFKLYTHKDCRRHRMKSRLGSEGVTHVLCSSGCGVRPGSPIISQTADGDFEVIGLAAGGAACSRRSMRHRLNVEPPLYIDVYPYITWIINIITANLLPRPYSHNFQLMDGGLNMAVNKGNYLRARKLQQAGWKARTYVSGNYCYKNAKSLRKTAFFYSEQFEVKADPPGKLNIYMKVSAGIECTITCASLLMPNRLSTPVIDGVGGYNISVEFVTDWFPYAFYFAMGLSGMNTTEKDTARWYHERRPGFW